MRRIISLTQLLRELGSPENPSHPQGGAFGRGGMENSYFFYKTVTFAIFFTKTLTFVCSKYRVPL